MILQRFSYFVLWRKMYASVCNPVNMGISRHINNMFRENKVEKSNMYFWHIANADRRVGLYSVDAIILRFIACHSIF